MDEREAIPKVIHYIWFGGGRKSRTVRKCIASWKKYCPDYRIIEWNEKNYDVRKNRYMYEAYRAKKWAFASDYARYDIIYRKGGIYLDTDVELIGGLDQFLYDEMFMGFLEDRRVASGLGFGSVARNPVIKEILDYYNDRSFYKPDGQMNLLICNHNETKVLGKHGLLRNGHEQTVDGCHVYPREVFNPIDMPPTERTVAINHFAGSWAGVFHRMRCRMIIFLKRYIQKKETAYTIIEKLDLVFGFLEDSEQSVRKLMQRVGKNKTGI